jgi:ribonuclease PH
MRNSDAGWITAEYGMMPRSTNERMNREAARGKQGGRTLEIQRLIGRSLRQAVNPQYLKDKTITVDCDVIQADGGTRTASITGGCVALFLAIKNHLKDHRAIKDYVAAVSLGIVDGEILVDLDYNEDSNAETDMNIVMTGSDSLIEIQGTAEENPFSKDQLNDMIMLASTSIKSLIEIQKACLD